MLQRSKDRYRWHLKVTKKVQANGHWADYVIAERDVHPIFADASHSLKKASGEAYFDDKLNVELKFINEDYDFIVGTKVNLRPLNIKYVLELYYDGVLRKTTYFRKTTCDIDENHHIMTVDLKEIGIYDKIEDKKADEVNVAKLGLEKHDVMHRIMPMMQVYRLGKREVMSTSSENVVSTSTCAEVTSFNQLHENDNMHIVAAFIGVLKDYDTEAVIGNYYGTQSINTAGQTNTLRFFRNRTGADYIECQISNSGCRFIKNTFSTSVVSLMSALNRGEATFVTHSRDREGVGETTFVYKLEYTLQIYGYNMLYSSGGTRGYSNDFIESGIYDNAIDNPTLNAIRMENTASMIPSSFRAIYEDDWMLGMGIYIDTRAMMDKMYSATTSYYDQYTYWTTIRDYFLLQDLIRAMLSKVDADLVYEDNVQHSEFFSSALNPVSGELNGIYYVTPKSNVLSIDYDYAAWKAMLTFEQLMSMIRNVFNCYYDIYEDHDGVRHFRIEHAQWYANGGSYSERVRSEIDLMANKDSRNKLPLGYRTKNWKYDTSEMPTKIEFSWMDDASEAFGGVPIYVPENRMLINTNYTEKKEITAFDSDLGYLSIAEGSVSKDGFVIVHTDEVGNIDFGTVELDEVSYTAENYKLSMAYLHDKFWKYGLCGTHAMINNKEFAIDNPPRMRMAEIEFVLPVGATYDQYSLIRTECGYGYVNDIELDLSSGKVKATVKYELETTRNADDVILTNERGDTTAADVVDYLNSNYNVTDGMLGNRFGNGIQDAMINLIRSMLVRKRPNGTYVAINSVTHEAIEPIVIPEWNDGEMLQYIKDNQFEKREVLIEKCKDGEKVLQNLLDDGLVFYTEDMKVIAPDVSSDAVDEMHAVMGIGLSPYADVIGKFGIVQTTYYMMTNLIMMEKDDCYDTCVDMFEYEEIRNLIIDGVDTIDLLIEHTGREEVRNYMRYLEAVGLVEREDERYIVV